jgi:tRNA/rRNA methyltransferase
MSKRKARELKARRKSFTVKPGTPKHQAEPVQKSKRQVYVVLVEPEIPGNLGFVARIMANFGIENLVIVGGCEITEEARDRAVHAQHILNRAQRVTTLEQALRAADLAVGTTAVLAAPDNAVWRNPTPLKEAVSLVRGTGKSIALVLGRESRGLLNDELERIDVLVTIPTNDAYPSLNVSHALAIVLYELADAVREIPQPELATGAEREALLERIDEVMDAAGVIGWRRQRNRTMMRRLFSRGQMSKFEFHSLSGILSKSRDSMLKGQGKPAGRNRRPLKKR